MGRVAIGMNWLLVVILILPNGEALMVHPKMKPVATYEQCVTIGATFVQVELAALAKDTTDIVIETYCYPTQEGSV